MSFLCVGVGVVAGWVSVSPVAAQSGAVERRFFRATPAPVVDAGFGSVVVMNGVVVASGDGAAGATVDGVPVNGRGVVHLFNAATGVLTRTLEPPVADRGTVGRQFGKSLALFGSVLAVGAPASAAAPMGVTGAVYLFNASTGAFVTKLTGVDRSFGTSVAVHGDLMVVGAPAETAFRGAVYVHSVSTLLELKRLTASDGLTGDAFGTAVAVSPHYILVGAPLDNTARGTDAGSGYLFDALPGFKQVTKLTDEVVVLPNRTTTSSFLGTSVAVRGQQFFLGAPGAPVDATAGVGFVLQFSASDLGEVAQLRPSSLTTQGFGTGLAATDDLLAVGPVVTARGGSGAMVFSLHNWEGPELAAELVPLGVAGEDVLGSSVAVHGNAVVAIAGLSINPAMQGAIYQLTPVQRPPMPGEVRFPRGGFAPGVPGASIADSVVQLRDGSVSLAYELMSLTGLGAGGGKNLGLWRHDYPGAPLVLKGAAVGGLGTLSQLTSVRVGGGRLQVLGKRSGAGITGANDDFILAQGNGLGPLVAFEENGLVSGGGGANPPRIGSFSAHAIADGGISGVVGALKRSAASGVSAASDSFMAMNNIASMLPQPVAAREGNGFAGVTLGQILPRLAAGGGQFVFASAIAGPVGQNQGVFAYNGAGTSDLLARKGELANVGGLGTEVFSTFLAESMDAVGSAGLRVRISGGNVISATNEALITAAMGFSPSFLLRKGGQAPGLPLGVRLASFLSFQKTRQGGAMLVLARLAGTGVNASNDLALFVVSPAVAVPPASKVVPTHVLLREGDALPSASKATVGTILRVAYCEDGDYLVLVSLVSRPGEATAADNLALLYGVSKHTRPAAEDADGFRKPFLLVRKGAAFAQAGGQIVKSLSFFSGTVTPGGASGTGMGSVAGGEVPLWLVDFGGGQRGCHRGGYNN